MNLLASTLWGGVYLLILFGLCFGGVISVRILQQHIRDAKNAPPEPKPAQEKPAKPEPTERSKPKEVYYIVEKNVHVPNKIIPNPKKSISNNLLRRRAQFSCARRRFFNLHSDVRYSLRPKGVPDDKTAAIRH